MHVHRPVATLIEQAPTLAEMTGAINRPANHAQAHAHAGWSVPNNDETR